jgi:hypothetical protein
MHDVLRQRKLRGIESLPDEPICQVFDFIEFMESKYACDLQVDRLPACRNSPGDSRTRCARLR